MNYLTIVFKLLGLVLDWYGASIDTRKKFLDLVKEAEKDELIPSKARDDFERQLEALNKTQE